MKIYISGKITGYTVEQAKALFKQSEVLIAEKGHEPVNPFDLSETHPDKTWKDYMLDDIKGLFDCEAIYMHKDWQDSKGARIEHGIAVEMGILRIYDGKLPK